MENQPNNERENKTNFYVEIDGQEVYLGPDNSTIYIHTYEPHYDHIFLETTPTDENNLRQGLFLWRLKHEKFDKMIEALLRLGAYQRHEEFASEMDKQTFANQGLTVPEFVEPEPETLTPRQVNLINFMAYLLLHEQLAVEDFEGEEYRELYI